MVTYSMWPFENPLFSLIFDIFTPYFHKMLDPIFHMLNPANKKLLKYLPPPTP